MNQSPVIEIREAGLPWVEAVAADVVATLTAAVAARGQASLVLSGGATPLPVYRRLAGLPPGMVPWPSVHVFLGDERMVSEDDPESNAGTIIRELVGRLAPRVARFVTPRLRPGEGGDVQAAALDFEATVARWLGDEGPFDLVLLGVGEDGHTASLFPGSPLLSPGKALVGVTQSPPGAPGRVRVTLTLEGLARSRRTLVLATGSSKAAAVAACLGRDDRPPAGLIRSAGELTWYLDEAAAGGLTTA